MSHVAVPLSGPRSSYPGYFFFHLLNLDAPSVAVVWQLLFAHSLHVALRLPAIFALAGSVWLIYVLDRLLDVCGKSSAGNPARQTARHAFHWHHRRALVASLCIALVAIAASCCFLRPLVLRTGIVVAALIALYMGLIHGVFRFRIPGISKEVAVGVLFAVGTCLAPACGTGATLSIVTPALLFSGLCCLNCAAIEVWEWDAIGSPAPTAPHPATLWLFRHLRLCLFVIGVAAFVAACISGPQLLFVAICFSALMFLLLDIVRHDLHCTVLRLLVDLPLLSPLLFLGLHRS